MKKDRNSTGLPFKGLGKEKCMQLHHAGILTAKDLLNFNHSHPPIFYKWKKIVRKYYDQNKKEIDKL